MPLPHYDVYQEQLTSLSHGHALWDPDPANVYPQVSVGDVGYVRDGSFTRMFNVRLEWNDPLNRIVCEPEPYTRLDLGQWVNIRQSRFSKGPYLSRHVIPAQSQRDNPTAGPDDVAGIAYSCKRRQGALLILPHDGAQEDVIRTKVFEDYIRDNVDSWFSFAHRNRMGIERMEDLILVSGCTLVTSWGAAVFADSAADGELSLGFQPSHGGGATFHWNNIGPGVTYWNSHQGAGNIRQNQCVFIKGFRAKRVLLWTWMKLKGAAEPPPDDPDNTPEDETEVTRAPDTPHDEIEVTRVPETSNYRDPLTGVLDYLLEKCPDKENTLAIAHDEDLDFVEEVDVLTADNVEAFLRQNEIGVLVENGAAILHEEEEPAVPDEAKATFYAAAELEGELVPLILHPVLSKYLLKLDMSNQVDHEYDLPKEEITSPAAHPPMLSLKLENHQGYPQPPIVIQASSDAAGTGVTVQDVLRTIHEDVRKLSRRREWIKLNTEERTAVEVAFRERCTTEEELGQGPCRVDYLRGRNRLQILPKLSPDGEMLPAPIIPEEVLREAALESRDESNIAGPSRNPIR